MAKTLTKLASFFRPLGGGSDDLVAVKLHRRAITVAEIRHNSNVINIDTIASAPLARDLQVARITRQHDMIADTLRGMREGGLFSARDAGIIIPSGVVTLRQFNLPYLTAAELTRESKDVAFWVEAGEISGKLDVFLDRLVEMLEKQQKIKAGIKSALFYPITLVVITVAISYFMLTKVVPTFQEMYEGLGAELPGPTQAIVDASNWIQDGGNLASVIGVVISIWLTNKTLHRYLRPYRKLKSVIALRLPVVGDIIVKATVARMSLLMANLLAAGVSVIDTLEVSSTVSQNVKFLDAMTQIKQKIVTGAPLSTLFGNEAVFPIALSQLMAVGERTGNMDEMLTSIARYYEEEFTTVVDGLSTIIEPLMIVFVGLMIGVMVVALYLPIFSAGDTIK
jgi:type II secretory pathway component PulF